MTGDFRRDHREIAADVRVFGSLRVTADRVPAQAEGRHRGDGERRDAESQQTTRAFRTLRAASATFVLMTVPDQRAATGVAATDISVRLARGASRIACCAARSFVTSATGSLPTVTGLDTWA